MASKLPYFPFYPDDWLSDEKLRACSSEARGLWIDLLCLMHKNDRRGYLEIANQPASHAQIARMTGRAPDEVALQLQELINAGVPSASEHSILFSRRMVSDERIRQSRSKAGKMGGDVTGSLLKQKVKQKSSKRQAKGQAKHKQNSGYGIGSGSEQENDAQEEGVQGEKPKRARTPRDDLFDAIVSVTHSIPKKDGSRIGELVSVLLSAEPPYTPEEVRGFPAAIAARNLSMPITLKSIGDHIGWVRQAVVNAAGASNGHHRSSPGRVDSPPGTYTKTTKKHVDPPGAATALFPSSGAGSGEDSFGF